MRVGSGVGVPIARADLHRGTPETVALLVGKPFFWGPWVSAKTPAAGGPPFPRAVLETSAGFGRGA